MKPARRVFLQQSLSAAACSLAPSILLTSCFGSGKEILEIDFLGPEERFEYFSSYYRKIKRTDLLNSSFEKSAQSNSSAVFLDVDVSMKATYTVFLIEQGKDIITTHPIASNLTEYKRIQEYLIRHDRKIALVNPLMFYPGVIKLAGMVNLYTDPFSEVVVTCHPFEPVPGFNVAGPASTAQLLMEIISFISSKYPVTLFASEDEPGRISRIGLDYDSFQSTIVPDPEQTGWIMEVIGSDFRARLDHTGLLAINNEIQPRAGSSALSWESAMISNLEDITKSILTRSEPKLSSLDGLASIILNQAVVESLMTGRIVYL